VPTWSTPTVHESTQRTQVIANGWKQIAGYDVETGKRLWHLRGGGDIPVPTPVVSHDLIFITNAHGSAAPIYAVRVDASGEITLPEGARSNEHVAWSVARAGAYMQTPLVYGDLLYVCRDNGVLSVYDARSGKRLHQLRLGKGASGFTASAVAAEGKIYYTSELGEVYVLRAGSEPELLATNELGEITMATPAVADGVLFFRTKNHLVAIGATSAAR
jgi:outer membrane protein assembly factor BamB